MIYDYEDEEGWVSVWAGSCTDYETLDRYLSTLYLKDGEEAEAFFLPENRDRPCEAELREYCDGTFNQFEYDFGLTFDEDFREAEVFDTATRDMAKLLEPFSDSGDFIPAVVARHGDSLPACNTALILYNFRYTGDITEAKHDGIQLRFLGAFSAGEAGG